ncbi:MAG: hypothetical protein QM610_00105 [Chitinophagaceae bacterium]
MAELKFRVYLEEDDAVYRDVLILHTQTFLDLNDVILKAYAFDSKHPATFFRSNDHWQEGREISKEKYDKPYRAEPLMMSETTIGSEIRDTNQKFIFLYDFNKNWRFLIELIKITKEVSSKITYPAVARVEGIGPQQYGTKSLLGERFMDVEEKYDLGQSEEGFGEEGEEETGFGADDGGEDY